MTDPRPRGRIVQKAVKRTKKEAILKAITWLAADPSHRIDPGLLVKDLNDYLRTHGHTTVDVKDIARPLQKHSKSDADDVLEIYKNFPKTVNYAELVRDLQQDIERSRQNPNSTRKRKRADGDASTKEGIPKRSTVDLAQQGAEAIKQRSTSTLPGDEIVQIASSESGDSTESESETEVSSDSDEWPVEQARWGVDLYLRTAELYISYSAHFHLTEHSTIQQIMLRLHRSIDSAVTTCLNNSGIDGDQLTQLTPSVYRQPLKDLIETVLGKEAESDLSNIQFTRTLQLSTFLRSLIAADVTQSTLEPPPYQADLQTNFDSWLALTIKEKLGVNMLGHLQSDTIKRVIEDQVKPNVDKRAATLAGRMLSKLSVFFAGPSLHELPLDDYKLDTGRLTFYEDDDSLRPQRRSWPPIPLPPSYDVLREELEAIYKLALDSRIDWTINDDGGARYSFLFPSFRTPFDAQHHKAVKYQDAKGNDVDHVQHQFVLVALTPLVLVADKDFHGQTFSRTRLLCQALVHTYLDPKAK